MGKRLLTSIIGIAVFLSVMLAPYSYVLYIAVALLVLLMLYEAYKVMEIGRFLRITGYASSLLVCASFVLGKQIVVLPIVFALDMIAMIILHGKEKSERVMSAGFITVLISVLMSMLIMTRKNFGIAVTFLPFVCAWLTDTGAYIVGSLLGRRKLAEKISPNKTVEGAIGGLLFSMIGSALFVVICVYAKVATIRQDVGMLEVLVFFAFVGLLTSIVSQIGDLAASCIKRDFQKKDYGSILPGHGGLLDRFDSVLLAIPVIYYIMRHLSLIERIFRL